ncbi:hypothetical protein [Streptomyces sp. URMC 129]|uniref:hypothetical protein n=1 Tax=Streptomyces sp. URMC 129 TaxID=3423407 RepID=UPI003F195323
MGSLRTPVGPLPSSIYWRRRAVVMLLIGLVVVLVFWALRSGGGGDEDPAGHDDGAGGPAESITPGPTPSESLIDERPGGREEQPSDDEGGEGGDGQAGDGGQTDGGKPTGDGGEQEDDDAAAGDAGDGDGGGLDPDAVPVCERSDVTLSLRPDANAYPPGEQPELRLTVQNSSDSACRVDFGHDALTLTLADAADERIWTSEHCPEGAASDPEVVPAGGSVTHPVTWDRRHSTDDCGDTGAEAEPGTYLAEATLSGYPVVATSFRLDQD